jgi:hypothetical protein
MGARSGAADQEQKCDSADQLIHQFLLLATSLPKVGIVTLQIVRIHGSQFLVKEWPIS